MDIFNWLIDKLAKHFGLNKALKRIQSSFKLGESSKIQMPKEVVAASVDFASMGLLNMFAIQCNLDWVLPYWVNRQYDPKSPSYVPGTVLSSNLTHRNWTAIGMPDSKREPIVDPTGLLTAWFDSWSIEFWIGKNDYLIVPAKNTEVYQYLVKQLPIVVSQFIKKDVRIRIEAFVQDQDTEEIICDSISVENLESKDVELSIFANIRPYNPEGISPINSIEYLEADNLFLVDGFAGLYLPAKPQRVYCSKRKMGDTSYEAFSDKENKAVTCEQGLAGAFAEYKYQLKPGQVQELEVRALTTSKKLDKVKNKAIFALSYQDMKRKTIKLWESVTNRGLKIEIPYQKMRNTFNANKAHLYLFIDDKVITPGPFTYHQEYFRDAAYSINALDKLGYHKETRRILLNYPNRQRKDGYFVSQEGEWDANGQALWTYYQHYLYTRDKDFLRKIFDSAYEGFLWIKKTREKETGLLPAGYSAEHFGPNDTFYWDNFWALAGIRGLIFMAGELNKKKIVEELEVEYNDYYKAVFASIESVQEKFGFPIIPSSPNRGIDSSIIGAVCVLYPLRLIPPRERKLTGTLRVIRERYQQNFAFFHRVIHSGYNVYLTAQLAQCYLYRRSSRVLPITQWIINNISRTATFPEAIHPITGGGCMGDGHHGWACADYLNLIRNILFFEEGENLIITPIVYHRWMEAGEKLIVKNAASHFGVINFEIHSKSNRVVLYLNNEYHIPPQFIEFSIPFLMKRVLVDNKEIKLEKITSIQFKANAREVVVYR